MDRAPLDTDFVLTNFLQSSKPKERVNESFGRPQSHGLIGPRGLLAARNLTWLTTPAADSWMSERISLRHLPSYTPVLNAIKDTQLYLKNQRISRRGYSSYTQIFGFQAAFLAGRPRFQPSHFEMIQFSQFQEELRDSLTMRPERPSQIETGRIWCVDLPGQ